VFIYFTLEASHNQFELLKSFDFDALSFSLADNFVAKVVFWTI